MLDRRARATLRGVCAPDRRVARHVTSPRRRRWRRSPPASTQCLDDAPDGRARRAGRRSTPTSPARSTRSAAWCAPAASGCARRSATGASSAPAATRTIERVVDAGAAFELMHAFALFHDDVMDDSASRRGAPTTHAVFADAHGDARLGRRVAPLRRGRGDPRRRPRLRATPTSCCVGAPPEVWRMWNELRIELNVGQFLDILGSRAAASAGSTRPSGSPATRAASTRSSGRCTSAPLLAAPDRGRRPAARRSALTGCRSATRSRCATT